MCTAGRKAAWVLMLAAVGCAQGDAAKGEPSRHSTRGPRPDEPPTMLNSDLPFRYPAALYARKVQGNVTLRLFVDRDGRVVPESTTVEESSGIAALDSAALKGSPELRFVPGKLHGEPLAVSVLFPVYFRHPEASPLPGDSVLSIRDSTKRSP